MPKIARNITVEFSTWEKARNHNINISALCEDALLKAITNIEKSIPPQEKFNKEYKEAWTEVADAAGLSTFTERVKQASAGEKQCAGIDRELWNKTYVLYKEKYGDLAARDVNRRVERTEARIAMFKQLHEAKELIK